MQRSSLQEALDARLTFETCQRTGGGGVGHCAVNENEDDDHSAIRQGGSGAEDDNDSSSDDTDNSAVGSGSGAEGDDDSSSDDDDNSAVGYGSGDEDDDDSSSDNNDNSTVRESNQAVRVEIDEESFLSFGVTGATEEDIDPMWQRLRNMAQPIDDTQLARQMERLAMNPPNWENNPIQLGLRCNECGERPCLWLEHREEMMEIHREYYDCLPIDDQPPNIIHRFRMYNEFVWYMYKRVIGEQLRARLPKCLVDGVHETYPG